MASWFDSSILWLHPQRTRVHHACLVAVGLGLWLVLASAAWAAADWLPAALQVFVGSVLLVALAVLARRSGLRLFGPVLPYDLVRNARRNRFLLYRIYGYFVLILVTCFFVAWEVGQRDQRLKTTHEIASFAAAFDYTFLSLQIVAVALLTPAYLGGVIAEEKERRTLEYLLATDLRNSEIVLSKLVSRVANLLLMLLTGLPVVAFVQFMGGIDPEVVLAGFAVTAITLSSLASLSVLTSVYARRARDAILYTYLVAAGYLLLSGLAPLYAAWVPAVYVSLGSTTITAGEVIDWFSTGNLLTHFINLARSAAMGMLPLGILWSHVADYAVFHGLASLVCVTWSVTRLRAVFLKQASGATVRPTRRWRRRRRPVGSWPMVWKELAVEGGLRLRWYAWLPLLLFFGASFLPLLEIYSPFWNRRQRLVFVDNWSQIMGALVACLLLAGVAVRAASAISGERDRHTLDSLLTSPLESSAILFAKWLGSLLSVRWGWLWLGLVWGTGVVLGSLHPLAVFLMIGAWCVYAALLAIIGLWFSLICSTSLRAMASTLFSTAALGVGLLPLPLDYLIPNQGNALGEWLQRFQMGLTPALAFGKLLPFYRAIPVVRDLYRKEPWEVRMALLGVASWLAAAVVLWIVTERRFRKMAGRQTVRRPEQAAGPQSVDTPRVGQVPST
jgi:ABC-type transport system involved in multi-copper enzyme maturation permease subunit